jgi:DNA-binding phage protein
MQKSKIHDPARIIDDIICTTGLKKSVVARRAGMDKEALCRSLQGRRQLRAHELLSLMRVLELGIEDFLRMDKD